jgi:hypothetical protein
MFRQMGSPSPVPTPIGLVVKKGSKIRSITSGAIPLPVSLTSTRTRPSRSRAVVTRTSFCSARPSGI